MLAPEDTLLVLLAAGRSRRFGEGSSKLDQNLFGQPLGLYAALRLAEVPFKDRLAVVGDLHLDYAAHGLRVSHNERREEGMATSLAIGVRHAQELGAQAVLIALADMPCITAAHVRRLFDASEDEATVVASSDGAALKPPALFGRGQFDRLLTLVGDGGARDLLKSARQVAASPAELVDVDTPEELARLRAIRAEARRSD